MKYVRTKDGRIIDVSNITLQYGLTINDIKDISEETGFVACYEGVEIIKYADTIEELCDEFVCKLKEIPTTWCSFDLDEIEEGLKTHSLKEWEWFGMIWTDKGLIYVAKMKGILPNGEIDWELL